MTLPVEPDENAEFNLGNYLPKKWYDLAKGLSSVVLPAIATFVLVLGSTWDWANEEKIAGTITALAALIGLVVHASSNSFKKATNVGDVVVERTAEGGTLYSLDIKVPFEQLEKVDTLTFDVKR